MVVKSSAISGGVNLNNCCIVGVSKEKRIIDSVQSMMNMHRRLCNKKISLYISSFFDVGNVSLATPQVVSVCGSHLRIRRKWYCEPSRDRYISRWIYNMTFQLRGGTSSWNPKGGNCSHGYRCQTCEVEVEELLELSGSLELSCRFIEVAYSFNTAMDIMSSYRMRTLSYLYINTVPYLTYMTLY